MSQSSSNKKFIFIALAVVVLAVAGGVVFTLGKGRGPSEPTHQGKTLSAWLKQMDAENEATREEAQQAVRAMGAKTLPALFARLRTPGASLSQRGTASEQQAVAISAFQVLGAKATPAIPELIELMRQDADLAPMAELALVGIGEPAVEPLKEALGKESDRLRVHAAGALWALKADAQVVMPPLLTGLKAKEDDVRAYGAVYLAELGQAPDKIVPALMENLQDPKPPVRVATVQALAKVGKAAKAAVPALQKLQDDPDESVRREAQKALKKIAG
jgi:HEAT repeat protein